MSASAAAPASAMSKFAGSVEVVFNQHLIEGEYKLLEVSEEMLQQIQASQFNPHTLTATNTIEFRGMNSDEAALVTHEKTYSVRLVESSNTQLLIRSTPKMMFAPDDTTEEQKSQATSDTNPSPHKKAKIDSTDSQSSSSTSSNDFLLPLRTIEGTIQHHYEVIEILPRLHVLRDLLYARMYEELDEDDVAVEETKQKEDEEMKQDQSDVDLTASSSSSSSITLPPLHTLTSLRPLIQASDVELLAGLRALNAFYDARGYIRVLNPEYCAKVLESIRNEMTELNVQGYEDIAVAPIQEGLKRLYPDYIVRHVMKMMSKRMYETAAATPASPSSAAAAASSSSPQPPSSSPPSSSSSSSSSSFFDLNEDHIPSYTFDTEKLCRFYAIQLFSEKHPYPHVQFIKDWQARVPSGMKTDVAFLHGHALCEVSLQMEAMSRAASSVTGAARMSEEQLLQWRYFPESSLHPNVKTRFTQLFDARKKWRLHELTPYVQNLCAPGQTIEQLLLKQTRPISLMENGHKVVVYTKR